MDEALVKRILARYPHASPVQRWHMRGRLQLCPYDALLSHLRGKASVLDIGCGFGHFAWYLAEKMPSLDYHGTDIDARKVDLALGCSLPEGLRPRFRAGEAADIPDLPKEFGNIVILDVLYLLPWEAQVRLLDWALGRLAPGPDSSLVLKNMDAAEGFSGWRTLAEEWVMVHLFKRTRSSGTLLGARPAGDYAAFARDRGFRSEVEELPTFNPSFILRIHR